MKRVIFLTCIAALSSTAADLNVTFYSGAGADKGTVDATSIHLGSILRMAGFELRWTGKEALPEYTVDFRAPAQTDAERKLQACRATSAIEARLIPEAPAHFGSASVGYSTPLSTGGVNVTIFYDRLRDTATQRGISVNLLLAYALAHEIGHVLQRSTNHSPHGLMSEVWRTEEFDRIHTTSLTYGKSEVTRMQRTLARADCEQGTVIAAK